MACEVPVVASRVGGLPEVVEDGVSGLLCDPHDVEGMARSAVAILSDPDVHKRFARAGLERVRRHFCAARVVPQYEAYYREVIGELPGK
jgi:glycosyltransferase involved in cell wall biosynthesis